MKCIAYNDGYKYQLKEIYSVGIDIKPVSTINTEEATHQGAGGLRALTA